MDVDTRTRAFQFTTQRPVAILMTFLAVAVFGAVSYTLLPLSLMPDLAYPSLTVRTEYPGSAPEEVETAVSRPIEQELGVVGNLVRISSVSRAGVRRHPRLRLGHEHERRDPGRPRDARPGLPAR